MQQLDGTQWNLIPNGLRVVILKRKKNPGINPGSKKPIKTRS